MATTRIPPRFELKFIVPSQVVDRIRVALGPTCELDPHCLAQPSRRYAIGSLYLDGHDLPFHRMKTNRAHSRLKLRVRHYPGDAAAGVFLELKRRIGDVIVKRRAMVPQGDDWAALVQHDFVPPGPVGEDFKAELAFYAAEPAVYVRYEREAWMSTIDDYARVTFDTCIEFAPHTDWNLDVHRASLRSNDDPRSLGVKASWVVVEMKFAETIPFWMEQLTRSFDLYRRGFSKYCTAVEQLYLGDRRLYPGLRISAF